MPDREGSIHSHDSGVILIRHPSRIESSHLQGTRFLPALNRTIFDAIGSTAAVCTTISFLPQLIRVWKRKSARDISLMMFLLFSFGVTCWLVYGIGIGSGPLTVANGLTLALALAILVLKLRYDRASPRSEPRAGSGKVTSIK